MVYVRVVKNGAKQNIRWAQKTKFIMKCKICKSGKLIKIGKIAHTINEIAGIKTNFYDNFILVKCSACGFIFKYPDIPIDILSGCYKNSPESALNINPDQHRRQFDIIKRETEKYSKGRRICDIGCSNGALLQSFSDEWDKFGIEPSKKAAKIAKNRNIKIIADAIENLNGYENFFDTILLIDVVEHLAIPVDAFSRMRRMLSPDGIIIILTGNTNSWHWKLLGAKYWYCSIPEHVCFFNQNCLDALGSYTGFQRVAARKRSHIRSQFSEKLFQLLKNLIYIVGNRFNEYGIPICKKHFVNRGGPWWIAANDHIMYVMKAI